MPISPDQPDKDLSQPTDNLSTLSADPEPALIPMPLNPLIDRRLDELVVNIRVQLEQGLEQAKKLLNLARVLAYWNIGRLIVESYLDEDYRAAYGTSLYKHLGELIGYKERVLQHMVQFYREYPQCPQHTPLTWTHYRYLINVSDPDLRQRLEQDMIAQGVSSSGVKKFIPQKNKAARDARRRVSFGGKLECPRGIPYCYAIRQGTDINGNDFSPRLDLGFKMGIDSANAPYIRFVNSPLVTSVREGEGYRLMSLKDAGETLYTYRAILDRVIDGDTFIARIELGFGQVTHQRLRLNGINAPEMNTPEGQAAKAFLSDLLEKSPVVVVKTYKDPEMYGRFLTDLYVIEACDDIERIAREGMYVNQELLDRGMAELYK